MERILNWAITAEQATMTIDQFLRSRGCSHHVLTQLKRTEQGILCNGIWAYTNQRLQEGDTLTIRLIETEPSEQILPVKLPLDIIYEDDDLLIINKSSDMPIHPSINNYDNTLANAVMYYYQQQGIPFVYRCINRLDRDTSGLLIIAKHMLSGAILSQMSARREIHREYLTIVEGVLPEAGTISAPIARQESSAIMRCVDELHGESAVTHYKRLQLFSCPDLDLNPSMHQNPDSHMVSSPSATQLSLARVHLETGRTHQIRVHMKHIGHPLVGDFLYNPASLHLLGRQALHSHRLTFTQPITGEQMDFVSDLPADMQALLNHYSCRN